MICGALDLFIDEDIDYARRLIRAGVPTEFHVYPGAPHAFNYVEAAVVTKAFARDSMAALKRALHAGLARLAPGRCHPADARFHQGFARRYTQPGRNCFNPYTVLRAVCFVQQRRDAARE